MEIMGIVTGQSIYEKIKGLKLECDDLSKALDSVYDELGEKSTAYKILKKAQEEKMDEFQRTLKREYEVPRVKKKAKDDPFNF